MRINVRVVAGGLCQSCSESHIVTFGDGRRLVRCGALYQAPIIVYGDVYECSLYDQKGQVSRSDMEKIGWILEVGRRGEPIGFRPPKKNRDDRDV